MNENIKFKTDMIVDVNRRIIALSDIHCDLEAMIICLRDCTKVIKKKEQYNFNQYVPDDDLYIQLNKNIWDISYNVDLGYEWCGGDTIVVIIGDLLDGTRKHSMKKNDSVDSDEILYYPHIITAF
jgi:predicted MPP superfamily phosphohydrolase